MQKRIKEVATLHGTIQTPAFFPDATYGSVKMLTFDDILECGINQVLSTTLHLHISPGDDFIKQLGGMHTFFGWEKPILTDSGGWQVFSLINQTGNGKVTKRGAKFKMPNTGDKEFLTPEKSIEIQKNLGSDIMIVLDNPILGSKTKDENKKAVDITIEWARRAKEQFLKIHKLTNDAFKKTDGSERPLLIAVIQGGDYLDLREECAKELKEIGFDGYGYGGIVIRENEKRYDLLKQFSQLVPDDKICYGMGVGLPEDIKFCIKQGYDFFDCVIPTRNGRHGQVFTNKETLNLNNAQFKKDTSPIDKNCDCEACKKGNTPFSSRAYLRQMLKRKEVSAMRLCSKHNIEFYRKLMKVKSL